MTFTSCVTCMTSDTRNSPRFGSFGLTLPVGLAPTRCRTLSDVIGRYRTLYDVTRSLPPSSVQGVDA